MSKFTFTPRPDRDTRQYFAGKGAQPAFSWLDVWGEEHALAFTVAKATELEVLNTIRGALQQAIDEGIPFQKFQRELAPRLKELGWWGKRRVRDDKTGKTRTAQLGSPRRLKVIYRANLRTARAAGQWQRAQRTRRALPYFLYTLGPSEEHRPDHVTKAGTILPVDHPFWDTWMPPNGWGCRCRVRQISKAEAIRRGGVSQPPDVPTRPFRNKRTGVVTDIPQGIDPGWHTNPGKARAKTLARHLEGALDGASGPAREVAIRDLGQSHLLKRVLQGKPETPVSKRGTKDGAKGGAKDRTKSDAKSAAKRGDLYAPVAVLPERRVKAMDGKTRIVMLSGRDAASQLAAHPDLSITDYRALQTLIDSGRWRRTSARGLTITGTADGTRYRARLRFSEKGDELMLIDLMRESKASE